MSEWATATFFCVAAICVTFLIRDARNRRHVPDKRLDRTIASLQLEARERGKLARRLAKAETKISRLKKSALPPADGAKP